MSQGIVIAGVVLLLILVGVLVFYFMSQGDESSSDDSSSKGELVITEEGAELNKGESKTEGYIQLPEVHQCKGDGDKPEFCSSYEQKPENGFAYVYNFDAESPEYKSCPGGDHDCWYVEQYDDDGTLVGITDKNDKSLMDKVIDEVWDNKWDPEHRMLKHFGSMVEFKDGKLVAKTSWEEGDKKINVGDSLSPGDVPSMGLYLIVLFASMHAVGEEKPSKVTINVKGAKQKFTNFKGWN